MDATTEIDFCSGCGFNKPIVSTESVPRIVDGKKVGTRELKYCAACSGSTKGVEKALQSLQPGLVDVTAQTKPKWDAAAAGASEQQVYLKARKIPKTVSDEIRFRRDRKYFVRGFLFSMVLWGLTALLVLRLLNFI